LGGHLYHHPSKGKSATTCITEELYANDTTKSLKFLANWLIKVAQIKNDEIKEKILVKTVESFLPFNTILSTTSTTSFLTINTSIDQKIHFIKPSSLFMIKILFIDISR